MPGRIVTWEFLSTAPKERGRDRVEWMATASKITDGLYQVRLIANLPPGQMLYSQRTKPVDGKCPTEIHFREGKGIVLNGNWEERGSRVEAADDSWVVYPDSSSRISYRQTVRLNDEHIQEVSGTVKFQPLSEYEIFDAKTTVFSIRIKK